MTPKEARDHWATELESGRWKQGTGQLARETDTGTEYCCLGVACELAVREGIIDSYDGTDTCLDPPYTAVRDWLGLTNPEGHYGNGRDYNTLANDNDSYQSFKQIAATIRNEPEGLIA